MIPKQYIEHWKNTKAPWQTDSQVEQDLILSRTLVDIFSSSLLRESLAFKGGTALQKLFVDEPSRYSEDIDLVQTQPGPIGEIMAELRQTLNSWLGKPKYLQNEYGMKFFYRYEAEDGVFMRIKIEINTREHFTVLGLQEMDYRVSSPWFEGSAPITTFFLEELIGTKLKALYQRKKGRDLFDVDYFLKSHPKLDLKQVINCFSAYAEHQGIMFSRAELEKNLIMKSLDPSYYNDIKPLLASEASKNYNASKAFDHILEKICPLFSGDPWNHNLGPDCPLTHFIETFKQFNTVSSLSKSREPLAQKLKELSAAIIQSDILINKAKELNLDKKVKSFASTSTQSGI
ncbi:MAG: hypothetical protein BGO67_10405 [Alphaproteobacteria bacterium 41-28]|nr:MAG: hypothetical protein BGO67_10405 [Alphaproteobacteria bacterium 41-28]